MKIDEDRFHVLTKYASKKGLRQHKVSVHNNILVCRFSIQVEIMMRTVRKEFFKLKNIEDQEKFYHETRFGGHKTSFNNQKYKNKTTLSTHIWKLKEEKTNFTTRWSLVDRAPTFNPTTRKCRLCLKEKWYIMFKPATATLNERSEFYTTCRHRLKGLLVNF